MTCTDTRYVHEVDGFLPDLKVAGCLLVPIISESGSPIGVCQALNKKKPTTSTIKTFPDEAHFNPADVKSAIAIASEVRHSKAGIESIEQLRDRRCPLDEVASVGVNLSDVHAKACFALKDGLGVTLARVILVDRDMDQLRVVGERSTDAQFPLAAKSLLAKAVKKTGQCLLRTPAAGSNLSDAL
jgi:hypothetical protein